MKNKERLEELGVGIKGNADGVIINYKNIVYDFYVAEKGKVEVMRVDYDKRESSLGIDGMLISKYEQKEVRELFFDLNKIYNLESQVINKFCKYLLYKQANKKYTNAIKEYNLENNKYKLLNSTVGAFLKSLESWKIDDDYYFEKLDNILWELKEEKEMLPLLERKKKNICNKHYRIKTLYENVYYKKSKKWNKRSMQKEVEKLDYESDLQSFYYVECENNIERLENDFNDVIVEYCMKKDKKAGLLDNLESNKKMIRKQKRWIKECKKEINFLKKDCVFKKNNI